MRNAVCATFAVFAVALACPLPADATVKPKVVTCAMTDPAGDVTVDGTGLAVPSDHVDLRRVDIAVNATTLAVTFRNAAGNDNRPGVWRLTFKSGRTTLYAIASLGTWVSVGDEDSAPGYRAGVLGFPGKTGSGAVGGDGTVRLTAPLSAFGAAAPRRGTVLSGFAAEASEKIVSVGADGHSAAQVALVDTASWKLTLTVGGACRP